MMVLITYDVNTETPAGRKRLRKVARECVNHGQRVQNSVFECLVNAAQYAVLKDKLISLIDPSTDSLRFYRLGGSLPEPGGTCRAPSPIRAGWRTSGITPRRCEAGSFRFSRPPSHRSIP